MINRPLINLLSLLTLTGLSIPAQAELLGLQQSYPDITLNQAYLIYDNNAIDNNTGLLKVISFSSTLNEGPASGNSTLTQTYTDSSEHVPDLMLSIAIDRTTGNWSNSSNNNANKVSIGFGNSVIPNGTENTPGFSWVGNITGFGWQQNTTASTYGSFFDASWTITQDNYEDMPASLSQFVDNVLFSALTPVKGGIKISNSAGFGNTPQPIAFQRDWVFGTNADNAMVQSLLNPFLSNLSTDICNSSTSTNCITYLHSTVTADVFVPIPAAFWLWTGALAVLLPSIRLRNISLN